IGPDGSAQERSSYAEVALRDRLRAAISRLNPQLPAGAHADAISRVLRRESPSVIVDNRAFHKMLTDGVQVEYKTRDGRIAGDQARLVDFDQPDNNDWLAVNQFTVIEGQHN